MAHYDEVMRRGGIGERRRNGRTAIETKEKDGKRKTKTKGKPEKGERMKNRKGGEKQSHEKGTDGSIKETWRRTNDMNPNGKPTAKNEGNQRNGHTAPGNETHRHANTDEKQKPRNGKLNEERTERKSLR